jgi:uncharacterized membrane protein YphA (DoxX/SURF4 family)
MDIKMNKNSLSKREKIKIFLTHPWCFRIICWLMGAVFIFASIDKILHPSAFANTINHYQILPNLLIPWAAAVQPWVEIGVGILLIVGIWLPGAISLLNLLLITFTGALLFNTLRGLNIDCGCFESSASLVSRTTMLLYLLRNSLFLCLALYLAGYLVVVKGETANEKR